MKSIIIFFLLFSVVAHATEIEVAVSSGKSSYHMEGIKPGNTLRLTILQNGYYAALENENFMLYGQDMAIQSLSLGYRHQFKNLPFFVYGQGGYYRPDYDPMGFGKEAIYAEQSKQYGFVAGTMPWSDHYRLEFRPDFGAEIGAGVKYRVYDAISVGLSIGYRYLRMWADYDGLDSDGTQFYIMSRSDPFSAVNLYGGVSVEF